MESEKVKEIKKALECQSTLSLPKCEKCDYKFGIVCKTEKLLKDCLTLINELESENELLRNAKVVYENVDYCYEDLKKAEKRIAELEEGIAKSMLGCEFLPECTNDKLKQFAERIKMEFYYEFDELIPSIMASKIDETLKEFIKD